MDYVMKLTKTLLSGYLLIACIISFSAKAQSISLALSILIIM